MPLSFKGQERACMVFHIIIISIIMRTDCLTDYCRFLGMLPYKTHGTIIGWVSFYFCIPEHRMSSGSVVRITTNRYMCVLASEVRVGTIGDRQIDIGITMAKQTNNDTRDTNDTPKYHYRRTGRLCCIRMLVYCVAQFINSGATRLWLWQTRFCSSLTSPLCGVTWRDWLGLHCTALVSQSVLISQLRFCFFV